MTSGEGVLLQSPDSGLIMKLGKIMESLFKTSNFRESYSHIKKWLNLLIGSATFLYLSYVELSIPG
jgi:hypothetical protein